MKMDIFATQFLLRFSLTASLLNLPPVLVYACQKIHFEPIIAMASLVFWATFPSSLLTAQWFNQPFINYSEFVVAYPAGHLMISTVIFWAVMASVITLASLIPSTLRFAQKIQASD